MFATSSSDRIAYYNPDKDEFDRFKESNEHLSMFSDYNYIDFHPSGDMIYFSDPLYQQVSMFEAKSGDYGGPVCSRSFLNIGAATLRPSWYPSIVRFNPYDLFTYVSEVDISSSNTLFSRGLSETILKFEDVCASYTNIFSPAVPSSGTKNDRIVDFAFGSSNAMFVLVEPALSSSAVVYKSTNYRTDSRSFSILTSLPIDSIFTGLEAMANDQIFLSRRYDVGASGVREHDSDGTFARDILPYTSAHVLDAWGIRKSPNGLVYVADYSFHLPQVFDPVTGSTLGSLGDSFGMLIFAHHMTFSPGPWVKTSSVALSHSTVAAGEEIEIVVDVFDSNNQPYCELPHLTAVLSGQLWVSDEPSAINGIWTSNNATRFKNLVGAPCHRHTLKFVPEIASLAYNDPITQAPRTDPRLEKFHSANGENVTIANYDFEFTVFTQDLEFDLEVGRARFSVTPGKPAAAYTSLSTTILSSTADELSSFVTILSNDEFQNRLLFGNYTDLFTFYVNGELYSKSDVVLDRFGVPLWELDFIDDMNGEYRLSVKFGPSDVHFIRIFFDGVELPQALTVVTTGTRLVDYVIEPEVRNLVLSSCSFLIFTTLVFFLLVKRWEKENAIRFSQRKFLYLTLWGMLFIYAFNIVLLVPSTELTCNLEKFFFHLGFWLIVLALLAKTYRTNAIANNEGMKRVKITDRDLLLPMGLVMLVVVVLIVADSLLSDFEQSTLLSEPKVDEETGVVVVWKVKNCVAGEQLSIYHVVLLICEGLGVFCLAVLAHYTRKVPSAFAESKYIAIAIYNILILAAIFVLLLVSLKMNNNFPNLMVGMSGFCIFFGLGGLQLLLFIPKFLLVIKGKDIDLSDITPKKEKEKERGGGVGMRKFSSNVGGGSSTNLGAVTSPMKNMAKRKSAPNVLYKHATSSSGGSSFKSSMGNISEEGDEEDGVGGAGVKVEVEVDDIGMGWKDEKTLQNELRFAKGVEKELRQELDEKAKELAKMKKLTKRLSITSGKSLARGMIGKVAGAGAGAGGGGGKSADGVPPPGSNWHQLQDDDGVIYYNNKETNACTYEVPPNWA